MHCQCNDSYQCGYYSMIRKQAASNSLEIRVDKFIGMHKIGNTSDRGSPFPPRECTPRVHFQTDRARIGLNCIRAHGFIRAEMHVCKVRCLQEAKVYVSRRYDDAGPESLKPFCQVRSKDGRVERVLRHDTVQVSMIDWCLEICERFALLRRDWDGDIDCSI